MISLPRSWAVVSAVTRQEAMGGPNLISMPAIPTPSCGFANRTTRCPGRPAASRTPYPPQLPDELIDGRFDHPNRLLATSENPLKPFNGLGREELFARVQIYTRRHVLDERETTIHLQC